MDSTPAVDRCVCVYICVCVCTYMYMCLYGSLANMAHHTHGIATEIIDQTAAEIGLTEI